MAATIAAGSVAAAAAASAARQQILSRFPGPFSFCFAYGSGVKQQMGYADLNAAQKQPQSAPTHQQPPMIDLILCVDDAQRFHRQNIYRNPDDYSALARLLGGDNVSRLQESAALGARVYCNTLVPLPDGRGTIKYGVVSTADAVLDLQDWRHLYVAGRLHKPVELLVPPQTSVLRDALQRNLESAVRVALLRLPESFGYYELFYAIANTSYAGDFRMYFGEKRDKVRNIVRPQLADFRRLYGETLRRMERSEFLLLLDERDGDGDGKANGAADADDADGSLVRIVQNRATDVTVQHLRALPAALREALGADGDAELEALAVQRPVELRRRLDECTERIVWNSSVGQSLKNIPTAGLGKAVRYSWQKVLKTFNM